MPVPGSDALVSRPFSVEIDLAGFGSGQPVLDWWLRAGAPTAVARRTASVFVWTRADVVIGYYSLSAHLIERAAVPRSWARSDIAEIPSVLLGKLALDRSLHGRGFGGALLADAMARAVTAATQVAVRYVVVDAIDDAATGFYRHHGFRDTPSAGRLLRKMTDIAADLLGDGEDPPTDAP